MFNFEKMFNRPTNNDAQNSVEKESVPPEQEISVKEILGDLKNELRELQAEAENSSSKPISPLELANSLMSMSDKDIDAKRESYQKQINQFNDMGDHTTEDEVRIKRLQDYIDVIDYKREMSELDKNSIDNNIRTILPKIDLLIWRKNNPYKELPINDDDPQEVQDLRREINKLSRIDSQQELRRLQADLFFAATELKNKKAQGKHQAI